MNPTTMNSISSVIVMIRKIRSSLYTLIASIMLVTVGCMDINPPTGQSEVDEENMLHSLYLPFTKAVYGVGDTDSVDVKARLVNGELVSVNPQNVTWTVEPKTSAVTVDSVGRIKVNAYSTSLFKLKASYMVGGLSRSSEISVVLTQNSYQIETFRIIPLDSLKGGLMLGAIFVGYDESLPGLSFDIRDVNGDTVPESLEYGMFLEAALLDYESGYRLPEMIAPSYLVDRVLLWNMGVPESRYWYSFSARLWGRSFADSVMFVGLAPAEIGFSISEQNSRLTVSAGTLAQPCGLFFATNMTADTVVVELSGAVPDVECGNTAPAQGDIVIPPGFFGVARQMGYSNGTEVTWQARSTRQSVQSASGRISFKDSEW